MNGGNGQTIFKKVALSEKKLLFREIADDKIQLTIKGSAHEEIFHLIAVQTEKDEALLCHHTADSKSFATNQAAVVNFSFKSERYFFKTELSFEAGWAVLRTDVDLFQLQRRANARVDIPAKYDAVFLLTNHGGKSYFLDTRVRDVSAGGFKMEFLGEKPELKIGDKVKGSLRLGSRRPMEFEIEVRFVQNRESEQGLIQTAGVQFLNVDHILETRLLSLMMDLQRELFLKYPNHKK
ncbi:PilZ domain-containing protein [Bdellovibrio sp. 22V]|uniref:flagellar brake protein n=1 Tax=Bdellovibrio TaxID=958 RepID=UPI0025438B0E|nr:PilZ domain-containing protein [Bdellovibrio sp. 22V]WII72318.1 PilZ domain-containing protein [Bdellovibrio sp. 22V]